MSKKKSLNFDFLGENPQKAEQKTNTPAVPLRQHPKTDKVNFFKYFKDYYTNFSIFTQEHLVAEKPRYLILAIWVLGIGNAADRLLTSPDSSTWGEVWAIAIPGGILSGAVLYYIAGWFYHIRVGWSKGTGTINTSRNIYVFSSLPIAVTGIGSLVFNHIAYGDDYFDTYYLEASSVDIIFGLLALVAITYSIYIGYGAVRDVTYAEKGRAIWWFVVAPVIFYILIFAGAMSE